MKIKIQNLFIALALFASLHRASATTIFPIATNASVVQFAQGAATSGSNYLIYVQSGTNVCFQLMSTNGSLTGSLTKVGESIGGAHVAFGNTNYLMIWEDDFANTPNQNGQIISRNGAVGAAFQFGFGNGTGGDPRALVSNGTNFLAVLREADNNNFYGQLFTSNGTLSGLSFLISGQPDNGENAVAIFGKTNYLVAWQSNNGSPGGNNNKTYGAFVSTSGSVGSIFQINQTNSLDQNPLAIGFDGTNYLVIWNVDTNLTVSGAPIWSLYGRLVSQTGSFPGKEFVINTNQALFPSLAFDGSNYLLEWSHDLDNTNVDKNVFFQFLNRSASSIGPAFTMFQPQGTNAPLVGGVLFDGNRFGIVTTLGTVIVSPDGGIGGLASAAAYGAFIPSSTASPTLTASNLVGTQFPLQLTGTPGINYAIQFSTNLAVSNWTNVTTNSPTNGVFSFTDTSATNTSRFYRALKQ